MRAIIVAFAVMTVTFGLVNLIPGDPAAMLAGDEASPERIEFLREELGLNRPLPERYVAYVTGLLRGDLGESMATGQAVSTIIGRTMPVTAWLVFVTLVMAISLSVPLAILASLLRRTSFNRVLRVVTSVSLAIPGFYMALIFILVFAVHLQLAPVGGYVSDFPENLRYLWLPALASCTTMVPILSRIMESSITQTLDEEFVEAAILRGVPRRRFLPQYVLRPSVGPTIAFLGFVVGGALGGAAIMEIVFNLPGVSSVMVGAVLGRDYPLVQGAATVLGLLVVLVAFIGDIISERLDPRTASA